MSVRKPAAILFDWDNTLVDTWPVIHQALHETFIQMGHTPWTLEEVKARVKHSARDAFPALFGDDWQKAADYYRDAYRQRNLQHLSPLPHALPVLERLKNHAIPMGIVSNKVGDTLRRESTHLGWDHFFGALIGATDTAHDKPHPLPVLTALEKMGLQASAEIWFMGDSAVDIEVAHRTGLTPILYGEPHAEIPLPFTHHFRNHEEMLQVLGE
jgi:phosphoglycolate phosphatase